MITVGIEEEKSEIKDFLIDFLKQKGKDKDKQMSFHFSADAEEYDCDIVINNTGKFFDDLKCSVYMFNSDEKTKTTLKKETLIISYGLNSLATVTASSIDEDGDALCFQYCLQRTITSFSGKKIEPQEFPVRLCRQEIKIHSALAVVTFALMCNF